MTDVHLEGMGVVGSFCAWALHDAGVPFTWYDREDDLAAWRACTGITYPSGDEQAADAYGTWEEWYTAPPWNAAEPAEQFVERAPLYFNHVSGPPHDGEYDATLADDRPDPPIKRADPRAYVLNAQSFVPATRAFFDDSRVADPPDPSTCEYVVTHGHADNPRNDGWVWGFSARAELTFDADAAAVYLGTARPCFYLHYARWVYTYIAPVPGSERYYVGSAMIGQDEPRPLDTTQHVSSWMERVAELLGSTVRVANATHIRAGWRPRNDPEDTPSVREIDDRYCVRPMRGNGVRLAPAYIEAVLEAVT